MGGSSLFDWGIRIFLFVALGYLLLALLQNIRQYLHPGVSIREIVPGLSNSVVILGVVFAVLFIWLYFKVSEARIHRLSRIEIRPTPVPTVALTVAPRGILTPMPRPGIVVTPTATPILSVGPRIVIVEIAPHGAEAGGRPVDDEYVVLANFGETLSLDGWSLQDSNGNAYFFHSFILAGSSAVKIHSFNGQDTETDLYWKSAVPIWDLEGDTAILVDQAGSIIDQFSYGR